MTKPGNQSRIQIALFWGDTPIDVLTVNDSPGTVTAGPGSACMFLVPVGMFPMPCFPLLTVRDETVVVRAGQEASLHCLGDDRWERLDALPDPDLPGVVVREWPFDSPLKLSHGSLNLLISRVEVQPLKRKPLLLLQESAFLNSLLVVLFLAGAFLSTLILGPRPAHSQEPRLDRGTAAYLVGFIHRSEQRKTLLPESLLPRKLQADARPARPAPGKRGKAGVPGAPDTGRRKAQRQIHPDDHEVVQNVGLLSLVARGQGSTGALAGPPGKFGRDLEDAIGAIQGVQPGTSGGWNGLDVRGTGPGGGGPPGVISGPIGIPVRPNGSRTLEVPQSNYRKPAEEGFRVTYTDIHFIEALPRELIRQVIHSHRDQIKYCYQRELTLHPTLSGTVSVRFVVGGDGGVREVGADSTLGNSGDELSRCIVGKVRTWQFPKPKGGGEVEVRYPFRFSPVSQSRGVGSPD